MFDITTLSAAETSTVELLGGDDALLYDDKGKALSITVYGPGTKIYQKAQARQHRKEARPHEIVLLGEQSGQPGSARVFPPRS